MHDNYGEASVKSVNIFSIIFIYSGCLFRRKKKILCVLLQVLNSLEKEVHDIRDACSI